MRRFLPALSLILTTASAAFAGDAQVYKYVDENGNLVFGDKVPAEAAERDKEILNEHGIALGKIRGRKSAEELEAERLEQELQAARQAQLREDRALLATYLTREEIIMHRDRRVELFKAQARVTELFLRNLERELAKLTAEAQRYQPYSTNPEAPMVDPELVEDIQVTRSTIERHEANLDKYKEDEKAIVERFDRDIKRFEELKGVTANTG
jgi:hypothetical protein